MVLFTTTQSRNCLRIRGSTLHYFSSNFLTQKGHESLNFKIIVLLGFSYLFDVLRNTFPTINKHSDLRMQFCNITLGCWHVLSPAMRREHSLPSWAKGESAHALWRVNCQSFDARCSAGEAIFCGIIELITTRVQCQDVEPLVSDRRL